MTDTHYAPAGRDTVEQLLHKGVLVRATPLLQQTIDAIGEAVVILNQHRQVVAANRTAMEMFARPPEETMGRRPGELLGCQHATEGPDGCGTSTHCAVCGAVQAVLESQNQQDRVTRECRIVLEQPVGGALDLKVHATTVLVDQERFTICCLTDISDQKRLSVLSRMFFHDMLNTAGGIRGWAELLREHAPVDSEQEHELSDLQMLADQLVEEIQSQRDLMYAETGDLEAEFAPLRTDDFLRRLTTLYARHCIAQGRHVELTDVWPGGLLTDARLLGRVLGNMIKNAAGSDSRRRYRDRRLPSRWNTARRVLGTQSRRDAARCATAGIPAVVQYEVGFRPRDRHAQHEAVGRALPGWHGRFRES